MPTLAELTLQLSQDITRNEHERAAALAALDGDRLKALAALPGAAVLLKRQADAIVAAQAERDETILDVEADLREAERLTANRRRAEEAEAEQLLREADDAAEKTRHAAEDKATAAFEAVVLAIDRKDLSPGEKVRARAEARRAMDRLFDAAQEAFSVARQTSQDRLLDERRAALIRELTDSRENRDKAGARRTAAEHVFGQTVKTSDAAIQTSLAAIPGAADVIASFAERRGGIERRFDAQETALHAAFREAREHAVAAVQPQPGVSSRAVAAVDAL
jgi:hypothetical protein